MLMINIGVYNHPSKHFAIEGPKVVIALERIRGAECCWLWKDVIWAWWGWFKDEAGMPIYRLLSFQLQGQCLTKFPSLMVFSPKRFIVDDHGCIPIMIEYNKVWATGTRLEHNRGWWGLLMHHHLERVLLGTRLRQRIFKTRRGGSHFPKFFI